jgi:hypothetical protein
MFILFMVYLSVKELTGNRILRRDVHLSTDQPTLSKLSQDIFLYNDRHSLTWLRNRGEIAGSGLEERPAAVSLLPRRLLRRQRWRHGDRPLLRGRRLLLLRIPGWRRPAGRPVNGPGGPRRRCAILLSGGAATAE